MVSDLFTRLAQVGPSPEHTLVGDHTHSEVINKEGVILAAHHFRRHVAGRAASVLRVVLSPDPSNSEVRDSKIPIIFNHQILRFDVSMNDILVVDVLEARDQTRDKEPGRFFVELSVAANVVPKVSAREVVHYQVQVLTVLKRKLHVYNVHILKLCKNLSLINHGLDRAFGNNSGLGHLFHGIGLGFALSVDFPDFSKAAFADAVVIDKVFFGDG